MHISVIIPAFNVAPWLRDCLVSLQVQTHAGWSAWVVDDGSADATASVAESIRDRRINLIRQANAGVSAARNRGLEAALPGRPDALLFLDADDWLAADALARLAHALDASPWAAAAAGAAIRVGDGMRSLPPPPEGCLIDRLLIHNRFINGGQILIRREAVEEAGLFRTDLRFGEDWEYWLRLALLGEFVSVRWPGVLFARERLGSAYLDLARRDDQHQVALNAIFNNSEIALRMGARRLAHLRARAEAEIDWTIGRELVRVGRSDGRVRLARSLRRRPLPRRVLLLALSWLRKGLFRPYRLAG